VHKDAVIQFTLVRKQNKNENPVDQMKLKEL